MISFVVFDLDGTLIDSRRDLADAANALLAEYGAEPLDERTVASMVGEGARVLVARVLNARSLAVPQEHAVARYLELYDARLLRHTRPYDGVAEVVSTLGAHLPLAVLTNKPGAMSERLLSAFHLRDAFAHVIGGDSPHGRKPDPSGLLWLVRSCGARPEDTVMVGDSAIDLRTARAAGTRVCLARYGFGFLDVPPGELDGSERLIDTPMDLLEMIGKAVETERSGDCGPG
jgi:phosphoglycolate phosphatase